MSATDQMRERVELISPPDFFLRLNELVEDPSASIGDIAELISQDPAVTARLLRIANSPVYGFSGQIDSLSRAISTIGTRGLRDLVLATSAVQAFSALESQAFDWNAFWRHSLLTGGLARLLGKRARLPSIEPLFVAGLLHDIGLPVIARRHPDSAGFLGGHCQWGEPLPDTEADLDHARLARSMLEGWFLPERVLEPVACHHDAERAERYPRQAAIVQIADLAATGRSDDIPEALWRVAGISRYDLDCLLPEAGEQVDVLYGLFVSQAA